MDSSNNKINYSSLKKMKFCLHHIELRNKLMDEEEDITQPVVENITIKNIIEICQQNSLAIQNLENDVKIKNNTSRNDDTYGN